MATTALGSHTTTPVLYYWGMVKDLDDNMKKELAKMLIDSLNTAMVKAKKTKKKLDACDYAGIWSDEEYMDADELVKVISDGRHVKSSRDDFWETL